MNGNLNVLNLLETVYVFQPCFHFTTRKQLRMTGSVRRATKKAWDWGVHRYYPTIVRVRNYVMTPDSSRIMAAMLGRSFCELRSALSSYSHYAGPSGRSYTKLEHEFKRLAI